ncbi:MAG: zinc ribbon domain-containing protein [Planctomycetota bacterium]|nr:zinc ribbon domain-containing protein [Planctomycetota bacterium]
MPIYEYHCETCSSAFEILLRSDTETPTCPDCGSSQLAKQWSVPAAPAHGTAATGRMSLPLADSRVAGGCGLPACMQGGCQRQ